MACENISIDDSSSNSQKTAKLVSTAWQLDSLVTEKGEVIKPEADTLYTLEFFKNEKLAAQNLCNQCLGEYQANADGDLTVTIHCSEAACPGYPPILYPYDAALHNAISFKHENERLLIRIQDVQHAGLKGDMHNLYFSEHKTITGKKVIMTDPLQFEREDWPHGDYELLDITIDEHLIQLSLAYSSCDRKKFDLVFWNWFMESIPVQAHAILAFEPDSCDAIIRDTLYFDLTPLKDEYRKFYNTGQGTIDISIVEGDEVRGEIQYQFNE